MTGYFLGAKGQFRERGGRALPFAQIMTQLTAVRDRDALDTELGEALKGLFEPLSMGIYDAIGDPGNERWLTRFQAGPNCSATDPDPRTVPVDQLPPLTHHLARCDALGGLVVSTDVAGIHVTTFPLGNGVLEIRTVRPLDDEGRIFAKTLLKVYGNLEGLLDYGQRDSLTGLLNRKTFDDGFFKARAASTESAPAQPMDRRAEGGGVRNWVGMIDIDHFKSVNDRFGHLIGDEVLLLIAQLMQKTCRTMDRVFRFGGEEFVLLIQCPSTVDAAVVFERLRAATEKFSFPQVGRVTVSVGFTELQACDSPTSALGRADKAVYFAKTNGRNQVRNYSELAGLGEPECAEMIGDVELF